MVSRRETVRALGIMLRERNYADNLSFMSKKLDWNSYLDRLPGSPNDNQIAIASGVARSNVSRWRSEGQQPKPGQAVAVARAYGNHPLSALVAAGYLTNDDLDAIFDGKTIAQIMSIDDFDTAFLATEVARRLNAEKM